MATEDKQMKYKIAWTDKRTGEIGYGTARSKKEAAEEIAKVLNSMECTTRFYQAVPENLELTETSRRLVRFFTCLSGAPKKGQEAREDEGREAESSEGGL